MVLHLLTLARMASTEAFQTKGFGWSLDADRYSSMAWINVGTLPKLPRRMHFSVNSRNHRSTRFSQEELVGVKWSCKRGCRSSQALTVRSLWVP